MDMNTNDNKASDFQVAIIGAGPAGIQAAYYLKQTGISYSVFEGGDRAGAFFEKFPKHRTLISINKKYTGYDSPELKMRWDWNSLLSNEYSPVFTDFSDEYFADADCLLDYLGHFCKQHRLDIRYNSPVSGISKDGDAITFRCNDTQYRVDKLVVATGLVKENLPSSIDGIAHAIPYGEMSIDKEDYINKRVLILGKGNSAFETADHLIPYASMIHISSPRPVQFAWETHYVGHLRAVNNNLLDTYQLKSQNAVLDADVLKITKDQTGYNVTVEYKHAQGEVEEIHYDTILSCCGFTFDDSIFEHGHSMCEKSKYPQHDHNWESQQYPGVYFAGTIMHYRDYRKYTSGFIHGFRYNVRRLAEDVACKLNPELGYENYIVAGDRDSLTEDVIQRINNSSAIWQQPGFMCDFYQLEEDGLFRRYPDLSVEKVQYRLENEKLSGFYITLEYSEHKPGGNLFAAERVRRNNVEESEESKFIHPIMTFYRDGVINARKHIIEDLFGEWYEQIHIDQVNSFVGSFLQSIENPMEEVKYG
jgi:thioredoxin reductase